jgi:hypothetical protein
MSHLYVAVTDLDGLALGAGAPPWPLAARLLTRADRRVLGVPWREWVLSKAGLTVLGDGLPIAAQLAQAAGHVDGPTGGWWLASPLRLTPGMSHVQVDSRGLLTQSAATRRQLVADFTRTWPDRSVRLQDTPSGLLVAVSPALRAQSVDPAAYAGRRLDEMTVTGPDAGALLRLMTELQMWLHERAVPSEQGVDVNALWLWGGGGGCVQGDAQWPVLASADPWLHVLSASQPVLRRADRIETWSVQVALASGTSWQEMEAQWWRTLSIDLLRGHWQRAMIYLDGVEYQLTRMQWLRVWRRMRVLGDRG